MSIINSIKHWARDIRRYPAYQRPDASYDRYWLSRDVDAPLNDFQKKRAEFLLSHISDTDSILDVGCGDGRILAFLKLHKSSLSVCGIDTSDYAISAAARRGIAVEKADIRNPAAMPPTSSADWVLLLEVLEHMAASEELLAWAVAHATKGVIFSVPNTGFFTYRLRLLLGRFPMQWKAHPSEHLRFWTVRDMRWWLRELNYPSELYCYRGVPLLNRLWPSLFSEGMLVVIKK